MNGPWAVMKYSGSRRTRGFDSSFVSILKSLRSGSMPVSARCVGTSLSKNFASGRSSNVRPLSTNAAATGTLAEYRGTYSQYLRARAEDERRAAKLAARQGKEIARLQAVVDRFGAKATKAAMAHNMEKRIARLDAERVEVSRGDKVLRVRFPMPPAPGRTVVTAAGLAKSYAGPPVFEGFVK